MGFSRRFPRDVKGSPYPVWEEVYLSAEEERALEGKQHDENLRLMAECITDAQRLAKEKGLKDFQTDVVNIALALFAQRGRHAIYWKEEAVKEKFDLAYGRKQ